MTTKIAPRTEISAGEEVPPIDYEKAFKVLSAALGREMISSDVLLFVGLALRDACGPEVARVYAEHLAINRSKSVHIFMG